MVPGNQESRKVEKLKGGKVWKDENVDLLKCERVKVQKSKSAK